MIERTLVLLKPDSVQRGLIGEILSRFERPGFKVIGMKMVWPTAELAGKHYANDEDWLRSVGEKTKASYAKKGKPLSDEPLAIGQRIRRQLMDFISMSPVVALCVEGHGAIAKIRAIVGSTAPLDAAPGTIRGDYAFDSYGLADSSGRPVQNLIHASDSTDSARKEIELWFEDEELHPYSKIDEPLLYRGLEEQNEETE